MIRNYIKKCDAEYFFFGEEMDEISSVLLLVYSELCNLNQ